MTPVAAGLGQQTWSWGPGHTLELQHVWTRQEVSCGPFRSLELLVSFHNLLVSVSFYE